AIEAAGIDIIIAQGIEAGGHRGIFSTKFDASVKTSNLVKLIKQHCSLPIVAAGGIMDGQQARQMLDFGADAVQLGTAFVQCKSSNANKVYRNALISKPLTKVSASISGRPARAIINHWHMDVDTPDRLMCRLILIPMIWPSNYMLLQPNKTIRVMARSGQAQMWHKFVKWKRLI